MTKLLDLIRDCRHRQVEELDIIKVGDHELKMKNGKFWSDGRFWTLEEAIVESMRLRALPEPEAGEATAQREVVPTAAPAKRFYRRGGR
jgi:hypothetical protein